MEVDHASIGNVAPSQEKQENPVAIKVCSGSISNSVRIHDVGGPISKSKGVRMEVDVPGGIRIGHGRVPNPSHGSLCHQCRRPKTYLVTCKNQKKNNKPCPLKICDRCLWNRYGDIAEEINALPDWSCPKCQGTCNCSACMKRRNLPPTGSLHKNKKAAKGVDLSTAALPSPKKEVLLLRWTEEWEKMNAGEVSGEGSNKSGEGEN